jgi:hypothetical protein
MQSDMSRLNTIDTTIEQILLYDIAFEEIKPYVYDKNKFEIKFELTTQENKKSCIDFSKATINGNVLKDACPNVYNYLIEYIGTTIKLDSANYKTGFYRVYITANGTQVSDIREYTITNDTIHVTNSGDSELHPLT